ncbi:hypothetical protein SALBM135S_06523 [Streptomyces alboniger]
MAEEPKPPARGARRLLVRRGRRPAAPRQPGAAFRPARKAHPGLRVRDIEAYADRLAAHGADVMWDDGLPGHRRFFSYDPVGNRLEFLEPGPGD